MNTREWVGALIAILTIVAFLFIVVYDVVNGKAVTLPDALLVLVSLVSGVYLGQHAATNGAYTAGSIAATSAATTIAQVNASAPPHP